MTFEPRGRDWRENGFKDQKSKSFRLTGPSLRPRMLIPYTNGKTVRVAVQIKADNLEQIKALQIEFNGNPTPFHATAQKEQKDEVTALLSFSAKLRKDRSSVLRFVQDSSFKLARKKGKNAFIAVGEVFLRRTEL